MKYVYEIGKGYLIGMLLCIIAACAFSAFADVPPGTVGGDDVNPRTRLVTNAWENAKGDIIAAIKVKSVNGKTGAVVLDAAAIPYGGYEAFGSVTNVEKGLDYAIQTADNAMTEATGRPTYDDLNGYLPLSGGVVNGVGIGDTFEGCLSADRIFCGGVPYITLNINGGMLDAYAGRWFYSDNGDYSDEYEIAVKGDIPKLPTKWALSNVTNANGQAVGANDVGALPLTGGDMSNAEIKGIYRLAGAELGTPRIQFDSNSTLMKKGDIKWYYGGARDEDEIAVKGDISADNPIFSNAVLAVGLNIDTNSVAALNEIAATFGEFPTAGTATTVGGLLAALAAAVALLRKKTQLLKSDGTAEDAFATGLLSKSVAISAVQDIVNDIFDNGETEEF